MPVSAACLIIGTSNTVRRDGYPSLLRALRPDLDLRVAGVGATPSVLLPYVLAETCLDGVSHVVVDTLVNDAARAADPAMDEILEGMLFESLDWLLAGRRGVIVLLLPQSNAAGVAPALRARRLAFCRDRGIPVLDAVSLAEVLVRDHRFPSELVLDDPQHIAWPLRLIVAERLAAAIQAVPGDASAPLPATPYRVVPAAGAPEGEWVERSTSLVSKRYLRVTPRSAASFDPGGEAALLGIAMNGAACLGDLVISSGTEERRDSPSRAFVSDPGERTIVHVVTSLAPAVIGRCFALRAEEEGGVDTEPSVEVEAAVFRLDGPPPPRAAWPAVSAEEASPPAAASALSPHEAALARAALLSGRASASIPGAARAFRRLIVHAPVPVWSLEAGAAAKTLAALGVAVGDDRGAERLLRQAAHAARSAGRHMPRAAGEDGRPERTVTPAG
ncbi:hypothetical protein ACE7GA_05880 [Roseomonas sp. CCTCC AB2023176]|uniref:hypothetical protein n=1 Tax=Roseomonas sp. CCTCC AB2023176 TaxID=3342640 RepID=UPI0035DED07F